jgi:hypothetical protein
MRVKPEEDGERGSRKNAERPTPNAQRGRKGWRRENLRIAWDDFLMLFA